MTASRPRGGILPLLALFLLAALLFHAPHLVAEVADTNMDFFLHHFWVKDFSASFLAGDLYPRWIAQARFGLGEPVFLYYSPLYYWAASLVMATGVKAWTAMQIVEIVASGLAGGFTYAALAPWTRRSVAILGALATMWSPLLVGISYKFNGFPWAVAIALFSMLFWAILRPGATEGRVNWHAAAAIAILTLLHTVSGLMAVIFFSAAEFLSLVLLRPGLRAGARAAAAWVGTVALGLALAALYLLPALGSLPLVSPETWTSAYLPWHSFVFPTWSARKYGMNWPAFQWPVAAVAAILFLPAAVLLLRGTTAQSPALHRRIVYLCCLGACALFFASELSYPLWVLDSPLRKIQYPWRCIVLVALPGVLLASLALEKVLAARRSRAIVAIPFALLVGGCAVGVLALVKATAIDGKPLHAAIRHGDYSFGEFREAFIAGTGCGLRDTPRNRCIEADRIAAGYVGLPEYRLPRATPEAEAVARRGFAGDCALRGAQCEVSARHADAFHGDVASPVAWTARLPLFDFPAWEVSVDGHPVPHTTDATTGLIAVPLPAGQHRVVVRWHRLPIERMGFAISFVALLTLLGLAAWERRRGSSPEDAQATAPGTSAP